MKEKFRDGLAVGSTVWKHDPYYRRYEKNREATTPIERFRPHLITGETKRSWIVGAAWNNVKFPKNCNVWRQRRGFLISQQEVDDVIWATEHRYKVSRAVEFADVATLRKVAQLVNYIP
jgi:hypothetical protein